MKCVQIHCMDVYLAYISVCVCVCFRMTLAHSPGVLQKGVWETQRDQLQKTTTEPFTTHTPQLNGKQYHKTCQRKDSDIQETYTYLYLVKYVSFYLISGNKDVCVCVCVCMCVLLNQPNII